MKIDLTFWLILVLSTSVVVNFFAFWYIRQVLGRLFYVGENLSDLADLITSYRNHLKSVYELEMFYGDETLKHLLDHTKSLHNIIEEYEDVYSIAIPPENTEEEIINKEELDNDAQTKIIEENVFYGGTRTSNN